MAEKHVCSCGCHIWNEEEAFFKSQTKMIYQKFIVCNDCSKRIQFKKITTGRTSESDEEWNKRSPHELKPE